MLDQLWNLEINITLFFQSLGDWLQIPMKAFTSLGNEEFYILVMPAIYWCLNSVVGFRMGMMLVVSGGLNSCFKFLFHSPRPFWIDERVIAHSSEVSFGLPSGHSQNAATIWGTMAVSLKKKWVTIIAVLIIFFIGISRIYLGVHFTRDVLTGWLLGGLILWVYYLVEKPIAKWVAPKTLTVQILLSLLFSLLLILLGVISRAASINFEIPNSWKETALLSGAEEPDPYSLKGIVTMAGVAFGFLTGYAWFIKRYGFLQVKGSYAKRFIRYFVGIIGVVILYLGLKLVFPEDPLWLGSFLRFLRYGLIGLWVSGIAPVLFIKLKLDK